jgi:hypothetical protein
MLMQVCDKLTIRRVTLDGTVSTLAGADDRRLREIVDGVGREAHLMQPSGIVVDKRDDMAYFMDQGWTIRRVSHTGRVTTMSTSMPQCFFSTSSLVLDVGSETIYYSNRHQVFSIPFREPVEHPHEPKVLAGNDAGEKDGAAQSEASLQYIKSTVLVRTPKVNNGLLSLLITCGEFYCRAVTMDDSPAYLLPHLPFEKWPPGLLNVVTDYLYHPLRR